MAVREILRMGDPRLLEKAQVVSRVPSEALNGLVEDMLDTMAARNGAGLAAPQIGEPWRVVVFGIDRNPRYPEAEPVPLTILVNPKIEVLEAATEDDWEGCLSVPGLRGLVPRAKRIRYRGLDPVGDEIVREAAGFHARVVQHEVDHLDGILYPQRMRDPTRFGFTEELEAAGMIPTVRGD